MSQSVPATRVLIVEDHDDTREFMRMLVSAAGASARTAADVSEALQVIDEFAPHLVLVDVGLPAVDGLAFARMLMTHARRAEMRLVAVTGYSGEQVLGDASMAGFEGFVNKPVTIETIQRVLSTYGSRRSSVSAREPGLM